MKIAALALLLAAAAAAATAVPARAGGRRLADLCSGATHDQCSGDEGIMCVGGREVACDLRAGLYCDDVATPGRPQCVFKGDNAQAQIACQTYPTTKCLGARHYCTSDKRHHECLDQVCTVGANGMPGCADKCTNQPNKCIDQQSGCMGGKSFKCKDGEHHCQPSGSGAFYCAGVFCANERRANGCLAGINGFCKDWEFFQCNSATQTCPAGQPECQPIPRAMGASADGAAGTDAGAAAAGGGPASAASGSSPPPPVTPIPGDFATPAPTGATPTDATPTDADGDGDAP